MCGSAADRMIAGTSAPHRLGHTLRMDLAAGACIVIPCFNEAARLDTDALSALADHASVRLLFVDDGSTDDTGVVLAKLAATTDSIDVLTLAVNAGKAEAVRQGM